MWDFKHKIHTKTVTILQVIGLFAVVLLGALLLWRGNANSYQAASAIMADVYFDGEYRIGEGLWQEITQGVHIPATKGDARLRGNFHMLAPDGEYVGIYSEGPPIAVYANHINLTFYEPGQEPNVLETENRLFGVSSCGAVWTAYSRLSGTEEPIEILIHNPHSFGNENAVDDFLSNIAFWADLEFEKEVLDRGAAQRNTGLLIHLASLSLLGIALFSTLIHIKHSRLLWLIGFVVLFAGLYFTYSAVGTPFWNESTVSNTIILGCAMMLYMLFLSMVICYFLTETRAVALVAVICSTVGDGLCFLLPVVTELYFYDTWVYWVGLQSLVNMALVYCLLKEGFRNKNHTKWLYMGALLPPVAFHVDVYMTYLGIWQGGLLSKYVFVTLFVIAMVVVLRIIPRGINAAAKAKELETEKTALNAQLTESRISTMMSQIRPHFIYNTLGSIEQLCELDPEKAGELVHNFAKYLRGNFGELDNPRPIQMTREMEHVHYYVSIEKVRFPDMSFTFEMNSVDFCLPALSIQPVVENAIKHGLMKLDKGGSIRVVSYETPESYCVCVEDDGPGFNVAVLQEDSGHMGLRNIRERLKAMVNGTIDIQSTIGVGTKVLITIPKEVQK